MKKWILSVLVIVGVASFFFSAVFFKVVSEGNPLAIESIKCFLKRYGLVSVFILMFIAGTFIPLNSPVIIAYSAGFGLPIIHLVSVATIGATLGICTNYYLARFLGESFVRGRVPEDELEDLEDWWGRWGNIALLIFGLTPVLPFDLLALVCGLLRTEILHLIGISLLTRLIQFSAFALLGIEVCKLIGIT